MWQDILLGVGGFVLAGALLPSFRAGQRPSVLTSLVCSEVMLVFSAVYASEQSIFAMCATFINFVLWMVLGVLKNGEQ